MVMSWDFMRVHGTSWDFMGLLGAYDNNILTIINHILTYIYINHILTIINPSKISLWYDKDIMGTINGGYSTG